MDAEMHGKAAWRCFFYFSVMVSLLVVKNFSPDIFYNYLLIVAVCSSIYIVYYFIKAGVVAEIVGSFILVVLMGLGARILPIVFLPLMAIYAIGCMVQAISSLWLMRATFVCSSILVVALFSREIFDCHGWGLYFWGAIYLVTAGFYASRIRYVELETGLFSLCFLLLALPIFCLILLSIKRSLSDLFSINSTKVNAKIPHRQVVSAHMRGGTFVKSYQRTVEKVIQTTTTTATAGVGAAGLGAVAAVSSASADKKTEK